MKFEDREAFLVMEGEELKKVAPCGCELSDESGYRTVFFMCPAHKQGYDAVKLEVEFPSGIVHKTTQKDLDKSLKKALELAFDRIPFPMKLLDPNEFLGLKACVDENCPVHGNRLSSSGTSNPQANKTNTCKACNFVLSPEDMKIVDTYDHGQGICVICGKEIVK